MARPSQDPKIRMDEILDVAEPLFAAKGYRKTTIGDIAKELNVAQGMLYYYFKSKEEILEALINRQISLFLADVRQMAASDEVDSVCKVEFLVYALFRTAQYKEGLFLDFLHDEKHLHVKNRLFRQATLLLKPSLQKIIEEGVAKKIFRIEHVPTAMTFMLSILLCLGESLCEKVAEEEFPHHLRLAEALLEKALGLAEDNLHLGNK